MQSNNQHRSNVAFFTLTYGRNSAPAATWDATRDDIPVFLRKIRKEYGKAAQVSTREAHICGIPHVHIVVIFAFKSFAKTKTADRTRQINVDLANFVKKTWKHGDSHAYLPLSTKRALSYTLKFTGTNSNVEKILEKTKEQKELTRQELQRLIGTYYSKITGARSLSVTPNFTKTEKKEFRVDNRLHGPTLPEEKQKEERQWRPPNT